MKGIYTVKRANGTSVCITYSPPGEKRVREALDFVPAGFEFTRRLREAKRKAEKVLTKRKAAIYDGKHELARPRNSMVFSRFVKEHYADELRHRKGSGLRTAEAEIQRLTTGPLGRYFTSVSLQGITQWQIQKYVRKRRQDGAGNAAINRDLARLSNLWNSAAAKKNLVRGTNPVVQYRKEHGRLDEPKDRVRYLTPDEEARLLKALPPAVRPLVEVAIHTGIRRGAMFGLQWRDVDFTSESIPIADYLSKNREEYYVRMNRRVREVLLEVRNREGFCDPEDIVFCLRDSSGRKSIRTSFEKARKAAKLGDLRFHDLRHTAASRIVMAGGTLYDAAQHLGHRSSAMTERYAHLSPDHMRKVAELTIPPVSVTRLSRAHTAATQEPSTDGA